MTSPPTNSIWSKVEKALDTHTLSQLHLLSTETPKSKRKSGDQLSAEKDKPKKLNKIYSENGTPDSHVSTPDTTNTTLNMETNHGARPKMIRIPSHQLPPLECIAAFTTRDAILTKDADHEEEDQVPPPTQQVIINILCDAVLAMDHSVILMMDTSIKTALINLLTMPDPQVIAFFSANSDDLNKLSSNIFTEIFSFISTSELFTSATSGGTLHLEASHQIAESITTNLAPTIIKHKDVFLRSVLSPARNDAQTKPLVELIINGANYDNIWKEVLCTLKTGKSLVSSHSLSLKIDSIEQNVLKQKRDYVEIDHQITKIATRMGDLKTSEMEHRSKALENDIRIHNINHLDEGTDHHFRALNFTDQIKRIHKLVTDHLTTKNASFTTQIFAPKSGSKHFEALAYVKFSSPGLKFEFEKNFANFKRNNPGCKLTTSRPSPQRTQSDRDLPSISDIKTRIGMLYNQAVLSAKQKNPNSFKELNQTEIEAIQVSQKERHKPFKVYYEFLCPSNNITFMPYSLNSNPFAEYDFSQHIPNPVTRKHALSDKSYEKRFPPKVYKK